MERNGLKVRQRDVEKYLSIVLIPGAFALASAGLVWPHLSFVALLAIFLTALAMLLLGCSLWKSDVLDWR